jgi:hypothetical protein
MFSYETEHIIRKVQGKVLGARDTVTLRSILSAPVHDAIKVYFRASISDSHGNTKSFHTKSSATLETLKSEIELLLPSNYTFSKDTFTSLLTDAVHFQFNYLCRPRWTMKEFFFHNSESLSIPELKQRFLYFSAYEYYPAIFFRYLQNKGIFSVNRDLFDAMTLRIDRITLGNATADDFAELLQPFADFIGYGRENGDASIPEHALALFFADKNMGAARDYIETTLHNRNISQIAIVELRELLKGMPGDLFAGSEVAAGGDEKPGMAADEDAVTNEEAVSGGEPKADEDADNLDLNIRLEPEEEYDTRETGTESGEVEITDEDIKRILEEDLDFEGSDLDDKADIPVVEEPIEEEPLEEEIAGEVPVDDEPLDEYLPEESTDTDDAETDEESEGDDQDIVEWEQQEDEEDEVQDDEEAGLKGLDRFFRPIDRSAARADKSADKNAEEKPDDRPSDDDLFYPLDTKREEVTDEEAFADEEALTDEEAFADEEALTDEEEIADEEAFADEEEYAEEQGLANENEEIESEFPEEEPGEEFEADSEEEPEQETEERSEADIEEASDEIGETIEEDSIEEIPGELTREEPRLSASEEDLPKYKTSAPSLDLLIEEDERKRFVRKLFNGDSAYYNVVVQTLNKMTSWKEASLYIDEIFLVNGVDPYSSDSVNFTDKVYTKFSHKSKFK